MSQSTDNDFLDNDNVLHASDAALQKGKSSLWGSSLTGRMLGGCRLEEKIGEGGMGVVYKAHHIALDVTVAVKIMMPYPGASRDGAERFAREARAAARLRHENIVAILNAGVEDELNFIVMEYIAGKSLQKIITEKGALPVKQALGIARQVLGALECAMVNGIIHRDIKPDNILITPEGNAKLADLGLAKRIGADVSLTQTGVTVGSPFYIAPEQASDPDTTDHRADIYSLGCVLFHMVTGKAPYSGSTSLEIILKHVRDPVPDAAAFAPHVPKLLTTIIQRMMAKDPNKRYQNAAEVVAALKLLLSPSGNIMKVPFLRITRKSLTVLLASLVAVTVIAIIVVLRMPHNKPVVNHSELPIVPRPKANKHSMRTQTQSLPPKEYVQPHREIATTPNKITQSVSSGNVQTLHKLLDKGVNPNSGGKVESPLHTAVSRGSIESVRVLLEHGANPSAVDEMGDTPLHRAIRMDSYSIVSALLDFGSNPNAIDHTGMTPLEIAREMDNYPIEKKLKERGAN